MGIFNTIWTLLITPNEFYTRLLAFPCNFIEMYLIMELSLVILNINTNRKRKILYVVISSLLGALSSYIIPNPYNVFLNYIMLFILTLFIFKITPLKALISIACSLSIFGLIGSLILNPYITTLNISTDQLANTPIYKICYLMLMYLLTLGVVFILKLKNLKIILFEDIDMKNKMIIIANFIFGIIALIVQTFMLFYFVDMLPIFITFLSFISLLAYFAISISSLTRVLKLTLTTKKLESAEEYNKTLRILHDNVRGFKHDFDNIVTTIGGYVRTNDMDGLKNYYLQLEDDCQGVNNLYLLNPEIINNPRNLQFTYQQIS